MNIVFTESEQTIARLEIDESMFLPSIGETVILNDKLYKVINIIIDYENEILMCVCEEI